MKKTLVFLLLSLSYLGFTQTNVSWIRYPSISPDGTQIAFMYKGDIFKVGIDGGRAVQLTSHPAYNFNPKWSPDGQWIAFNSNRHGNQDVFIMPSEGGTPRRLTTHSGNERLQTFSPDGRYIYFTANIQHPASFAHFPAGWATQLFRVSVEGGRPFLVLPNAMNNVNISSDGSFLVFEDIKGGENEWRKHQQSAVSRDIWKYNFATREFTQLTQDINIDSRNPVLSQDGQTVYFMSERAGSFNIWRAPMDNVSEAVQVTHHERHPVRFVSISHNGTLCYTFNGFLFVRPQNGESRQVQVDIFRDSEVVTTQFLTTGATEAAFSPNGKEVAIVVRGDVYVTSVDFGTTRRITNTPGVERWVSWAPDGRSLVFASEQNGNWRVKIARNVAEHEPYFFSSNNITTEFLVNDDNFQDFQPSFAPNGREVAFLRNRTQIHVIDLQTRRIRQVTDGRQNFSARDGSQSFAWSPDSRWFVLTFMGAVPRHPFLDIGLVSAQGGEIINLTNSGYFQEFPRFAMHGNMILFASDRFGMRSHASWGSQNDVFGIFTNQAALDRFRMSREDVALYNERHRLIHGSARTADTIMPELELRNIENRIERLTIHSTDLGGFAITPNGERLFYLARVERGFDLWMRDFTNNETRRIEQLNVQHASLEIDARGERLMVFAGGTIFTLDVRNTGNRTNITYRAQVDANPFARRSEMFKHVWRTVSDMFYREDLHGVDWDGLKKDHTNFLPHINNNWDFAEFLSEFLGELNASHTGGRYNPPAPAGNLVTGRIGLFFDLTTRENGLRIEEVLTNGPFDNARSRVRAGHFLTHIDGVEILENTDFFALLNGNIGREVTFTFREGRTQYTERIRPIANEQPLLYNRWVQNQRDRVAKLSNGRLGYVHVQQMNDGSFRTIFSEIFGRNYGKEGIVVDIRFNGGGRMHEDLEVLLSGTKYLEQVPRGQKINNQPTRRWLRPSIMLQNEASYSNAHGTAWVYREMGIGKLVGMPVPGTMTTVWWNNLPEPGLLYGIPIAGFIDRHGNFLENQQLYPDFQIRNETNLLWENRDQQIEEAVRVLLQEADNFVDPWREFDYNQPNRYP
ncbi:MAG: S41 family peptidase [Bacteroidales bacterium]|nr:S41 family peptidase [Bacteroidales bacterium]